MWIQTMIADYHNVSRPCVWCDELKIIVFDETQLSVLNPELIKEVCEKHNASLKHHGKWNRDLVKDIYNQRGEKIWQ